MRQTLSAGVIAREHPIMHTLLNFCTVGHPREWEAMIPLWRNAHCYIQQCHRPNDVMTSSTVCMSRCVDTPKSQQSLNSHNNVGIPSHIWYELRRMSCARASVWVHFLQSHSQTPSNKPILQTELKKGVYILAPIVFIICCPLLHKTSQAISYSYDVVSAH